MKELLLVLLILPIATYAQDPMLEVFERGEKETTTQPESTPQEIQKTDLDVLEELKLELESNIEALEKQLSLINSEIEAEKFRIRNRPGSNRVLAWVTRNTSFHEYPTLESKRTTTLTVNDSVVVMQYQDNFFLAVSPKGKGYIHSSHLRSNSDGNELMEKMKEDYEIRRREEDARKRQEKSEMISLKRAEVKEKEKKEQAALAEQKKKDQKAANIRLASLTKKYGEQIAQRIMERSYWIGMTKEIAKESLGEPTEITRTVGSFGTHEQWFYDYYGIYLYFENGECTSFQDGI